MRNRLSVSVSELVLTVIILAVAAASGSTLAQANGDNTMNTYLVIRFEADDAKLDEFSAIMRSVDTDMQTEPGFVSATVYQDIDDPRVFTLVELWESRKSHEEHFEKIVESGAWEHILSLLRKKPKMGYTERL